MKTRIRHLAFEGPGDGKESPFPTDLPINAASYPGMCIRPAGSLTCSKMTISTE
jgi:hypothetical protein